MSALPDVFSFWHGPLSWLERTAIASFVAHGHKFVLYGFERPEGLPDGCVWQDAATLVPREKMFFYKGDRSPAVFADWLRLMLLAQGRGIWVDCDMVCLKPLAGLSPYVFGMEVPPGRGAHGGQINNAVLRLPPDSPLLEDLLTIFRADPEKIDPVWMPWYRRAEVAARRLVGQKVGLTHMQFGATGPFPLTHFARKRGVAQFALAPEAFYPVPYAEVANLTRPGPTLESFLSEASLGVHLWRMALTARGRTSMPPLPEPGSALDALRRRYDPESARA